MLIDTKRFKLSRRGAFLVLHGLLYLLIGYSFFDIDPLFKPIIEIQFKVAVDLMPLEAYGVLWLISGVLVIIGGLVHELDGMGFSVGVFMPLLWSLLFITAWIEGVPRAWLSSGIYFTFSLAILIVGGMHDPLDPFAVAGRPLRMPKWLRGRK